MTMTKVKIGNVASLSKLPVLTKGTHIAAGVVRDTKQIDRQIDAAIGQLKLDPNANGFGHNRTAFIGVGYDVGDPAKAGLSFHMVAGASLVDHSLRGRLTYSGTDIRGDLMGRYDVKPSLNIAAKYRF
ncbi:MAG: hypothetical protein AAF768_00155 [Pseudomonadota bacterium]